jgi:hypothetical protein
VSSEICARPARRGFRFLRGARDGQKRPLLDGRAKAQAPVVYAMRCTGGSEAARRRFTGNRGAAQPERGMMPSASELVPAGDQAHESAHVGRAPLGGPLKRRYSAPSAKVRLRWAGGGNCQA